MIGIEVLFGGHLPTFTDNIVPLLQDMDILLHILVLGPSLEMLERVESLDDTMVNLPKDILTGGLHHQPFSADVRNDLAFFNGYLSLVVLVAACAHVHVVQDQEVLSRVLVRQREIERQGRLVREFRLF